MGRGIYTGFYDNTKLLEATDANGVKPEVYFVCSRGRSAGKTYQFSKTLWEHYEKTGDKFIILTRHIQDLQGGSIAYGVMKGFLDYARPGVTLSEKTGMRGVFNNVFAHIGTGDEAVTEHVGYVIPLAADSKIKNVSSMFVDAWAMFMDEFQPMRSNEFLTDEVQRLDTIHTSVARGGGQSIRYVPVFMCSNAINIFNPYFVACGIVKNIQSNTRIYRGDGFIYERCMVKGLDEKRAETGFARTFKTAENTVEDDNSWLADSGSCVEQPNGWGRAFCIGNLMRGNEMFGVKYYEQVGLYYVDRKPQKVGAPTYALTLGDNLNVPFIRQSPFMKKLKTMFMGGRVRVKDSGVQSMLLDLFV